MSTKKVTEADRTEAREALARLLPPGSTVYAIVRSVARSGTLRTLDLYAIDPEDARPVYISGRAGLLTGIRRNRKGALVPYGGGTYAAFEAVSALSRALYPDGYACIGDRCPSEDHRNHPRSVFEHHAHGDYALRREWL